MGYSRNLGILGIIEIFRDFREFRDFLGFVGILGNLGIFDGNMLVRLFRSNYGCVNKNTDVSTNTDFISK